MLSGNVPDRIDLRVRQQLTEIDPPPEGGGFVNPKTGKKFLSKRKCRKNRLVIRRDGIVNGSTFQYLKRLSTQSPNHNKTFL